MIIQICTKHFLKSLSLRDTQISPADIYTVLFNLLFQLLQRTGDNNVDIFNPLFHLRLQIITDY